MDIELYYINNDGNQEMVFKYKDHFLFLDWIVSRIKFHGDTPVGQWFNGTSIKITDELLTDIEYLFTTPNFYCYHTEFLNHTYEILDKKLLQKIRDFAHFDLFISWRT